MTPRLRGALLSIAAAVCFGVTGCAQLGPTGALVQQWTVRGVGALGAFVLHEGCHLALGAAMGADMDAQFRGNNLYLGFDDISRKQHRAIAIAGNACTGIAAEIIVDTGAHKKSDLAWGMAAFHSINVFGYAFSKSGDAEHWSGSGGSETTWKTLNAVHASRIGTQLAYDSEFGQYLRRRWSAKAAPPRRAILDPLDFTGPLRSECIETGELLDLPGPYAMTLPPRYIPSTYLQSPSCASLPLAAVRVPPIAQATPETKRSLSLEPELPSVSTRHSSSQ